MAVSWLGLGRAEAQQCSKFQVSAAVGDASTPLPTDGVQILLNCPSCNAGNFLLPGSLSFGWSAGTYQVQVYQASNYFIVPYRPLGTCTYNADLGCSDCAGSVSVSMFATRGTIDGTVTD